MRGPSRRISVVVKIKGPLLDTLEKRCRILTGTQKETIILTTIPNYDFQEVWIRFEQETDG